MKKYWYVFVLVFSILLMSSCVIQIPFPPEPPSNLEAEALSSTEIKLTWQDNSTNEEGFEIERKTEVEEWSQIKTVEANIKEYTDSGLSTDTTYYYRVRAYNSVGDSNYSNEANATTPDVPPNNVVPAAPSNLEAEALSSTEIKLTWQDNSTNETGFKIERKVGASGNWSEIKTVGVNIKEYTDSGLNPNTTYYYRVRAYNSVGNSSYSEEINAQTPLLKLREVGHYDTVCRAWKVCAKDNYAYVADDCNGLVIVNINNPTMPQQVGHCYTAGHAEGVYVKDNYAYVADWENGLVIVNISNPTMPQQVGHYDTANYTEGVYVKDNYAYVADGKNGLVIVNISNPTNPKQVGYYDTAGEASHVYVKDNYAYVADGWNGLEIVNVSDLTNPKQVGNYAIGYYAGEVYVKDNYVYVAFAYSGLAVVDVSDPNNPEQVGHFNAPHALGVYVKDNYAYVACREDGLLVVDVSDPINPKQVGYYDTRGAAYGVYVKDDYAYVADDENGLVIVDVSYF